MDRGYVGKCPCCGAENRELRFDKKCFDCYVDRAERSIDPITGQRIQPGLKERVEKGKPTMASALSREDRIAIARRKLPLDVLERKARIARRRHMGTMEDCDLSLAKSWRWCVASWEKRPAVRNYCSLCGQFGTGPWNDETKRYAGPISHKRGCVWGPTCPEPYPGDRDFVAVR